jgi:sodium/proline symporter
LIILVQLPIWKVIGNVYLLFNNDYFTNSNYFYFDFSCSFNKRERFSMNELVTPGISANIYTIFSFILYLIIVMVIGIFSTRYESEGISEFFMGAAAVWSVVGYITVEMFLFIFYARRLRRFSETYDCITVPDFFARRFNDKSGVLRIVLVLIILIFMVSYVSAQFVAGGKAFAASFQINQTQGVLLTAGIVLFYTMLGGFMAVSLTDMIQGVFMIFALVMLPVIAITDRGGFSQVIYELNFLDPQYLDPLALSIGMAVGFVGIGLGSPGNPHIVARYMSIKDPEQLRYSAVVGTIWNVIMAWGALFIGLVGRVYFPDVTLLPGSDTENLYPTLAQQHLHPILFGMVIASIFAAIMSTADSQLLVAASSLVRDFYEKVLNRNRKVSQKKLVIYSRAMVFVLVLISLGLGLLAQRQIFWLVLVAWAGLGAALGPTSILALYWKRTTRTAVLLAMILSTILTIFWFYTPDLKDFIYELVPAFVISMLVTIFVSLRKNIPERVEKMFVVMSGRRQE